MSYVELSSPEADPEMGIPSREVLLGTQEGQGETGWERKRQQGEEAAFGLSPV